LCHRQLQQELLVLEQLQQEQLQELELPQVLLLVQWDK
jgi:hypothetical protein